MVCAVAVLFLPASSHPLLELAGWIHEEAYHHHHNGDDAEHHHHPVSNDHDAADGICRLESGGIDAPIPTNGAWWLVGYALWSILDSVVVEPPFSGPSPPGTAPPEIQVSWQFSYRAAVPVRAPSFLS